MNNKKLEKYLKRYDKFSNNNLPTPFWDDERFTLEYVYKDDNIIGDNKLRIDYSLTESLANLTFTSFYYPFESKAIETYFNDNKKIENEVIKKNHAHSFEEVVRELYKYPESFSILKSDEKFYSKQELEYLRRVKKYLLFIGLKDLNGVKDPLSRYRNRKHEKYKNAYIYNYSNKLIENIISKKQNCIVTKYYKEYIDSFEFKKFQALILDEEDNFKLLIEFNNREIKNYEDVKEFCNIKNLKSQDKVVVTYFNIIEKFDDIYE